MTIREEFHGVPPDVQPVLNQMIKSLNRLTVLDQEQVLEVLMARHILRRSYPGKDKVIDVLAEVVTNLAAVLRKAMEESRARQG